MSMDIYIIIAIFFGVFIKSPSTLTRVVLGAFWPAVCLTYIVGEYDFFKRELESLCYGGKEED